MNKKLLLGAIVVLCTTVGTVGTTHADPPANSGWDENPDVAIGGGSDTTYLVAQRLEVLYNAAAGCAINTAELTAKGKCVTTAPGVQSGPVNGNYDHDLMISAAPTGSGSGVDALRVGMAGVANGTFTQYNPQIDYARSSSTGNAARLGNTTYWGYARDSINVITFGTAHGGLCVTQLELKRIYGFSDVANGITAITNWDQLRNCAGVSYPSAPIIPWAMNSASGTNGSFTTYLAGTDPATIGRRLQPSNVAPFENDIKPLLADGGPNGTVGDADDDENNYIWWMSGGNWSQYPYTKNGCINGVGTYSPLTGTCSGGGTSITTANASVSDTGAVNTYILPSTGTINANTYPIRRTLWHVTRNIDADCRVLAGTAGTCTNAGLDDVFADPAAQATLATNLPGYSVARAGAVREFTRWLCRNGSGGLNPVTGRTALQDKNAALTAEGFAPTTTTNSPGYRCEVAT
jgi:ABC-type phosphate transport system substrate-binding protein